MTSYKCDVTSWYFRLCDTTMFIKLCQNVRKSDLYNIEPLFEPKSSCRLEDMPVWLMYLKSVKYMSYHCEMLIYWEKELTSYKCDVTSWYFRLCDTTMFLKLCQNVRKSDLYNIEPLFEPKSSDFWRYEDPLLNPFTTIRISNWWISNWWIFFVFLLKNINGHIFANIGRMTFKPVLFDCKFALVSKNAIIW